MGCGRVFRDVTERRWDEQRVHQSEERYRALVTASAQIVWATDPRGEVVEDSPSWRAFTGQTYDQWKGWGWVDAVHPDDREQTAAAWRKAVENKSVYAVEYRLRRHDGEFRWTAARSVPVLNADGSIREWVGPNTDVTELKRADMALRESEAHFRSMADHDVGDRSIRFLHVHQQAMVRTHGNHERAELRNRLAGVRSP